MKVCFVWFPTLLLGRLLFGTGSGIISFCYGKALNETVPIEFNQNYGLLTNLGFNMGVMVCGFVSLILPANDADDSLMLSDETWRFVYGSTLILQFFGMIFILFFMKNPSLNQLVGDGNREQAFLEIEKIYLEADKEKIFVQIS